jgi:hypothetical protein
LLEFYCINSIIIKQLRMLTSFPRQLLLLTVITALTITCANNNKSTEQTATEEKQLAGEQATPIIPVNSTSAKEILAAIDCGTILTTAMVEELCGKTGIVERISSIERKGANCNRLYGVGKNAWGDELVFIVTVLKDATAAASGINRMKKDNASNGLSTISNIGDEAFTLVFKDPLTKRENHQLVFRKNGFLVELKTNESRSAKTPCPCYEMDKLKKLAENVAGKL